MAASRSSVAFEFRPDVRVLSDVRSQAVTGARSLHVDVDPEVMAVVVGELAANAAIHAEGPATLTLTAVSGGGVEVAVADRTHEPVTIAGEDGGGHRGLVLVDALSESWGVDQTPDGKRVWAVVGPRTA